MVINEIFYSIQGEGLLAGVPSVFIRLAGCPLRCTWCDTQYALDPKAGEDLSLSEMLDRIESVFTHLSHEPRVTSHERRFIVITGGEPMINPQLPELAATLKQKAKHVTIETAGFKFIPDIACDLMSISPKLSNSGVKIKKVPDPFFPIRQLIEHYPYQLKFVVDSPDDITEIQQTVKLLGNIDPKRIMLMPQAKTRDELLAKSSMVAELCKQTGFAFCNRLQILLWNNKRGT